MTVDSVLKKFNKIVSKLEGHAEEEKAKIGAKLLKCDKLQAQVGAHQTEAAKAEAVASKIKQLLS
jgi:hypothetical protein